MLIIGACASRVPKYDKVEQLKTNEEFERIVKIEAVPTETPKSVEPVKTDDLTLPKSAGKTGLVKKTKSVVDQATAKGTVKSKPTGKTKPAPKPTPEVPTRRQPEIESDVGFAGRRPLKDPFRVGEKVTHAVRYFKVSAGKLSMEVLPLVTVNGRKSYNFLTSIKSSSVFSSFYSVDDNVETLVDFENLVPNVFNLHVKESGQLKEAKSFFDHANMKATYWEKKVTEKSGVEEKKKEWELAPYAQNVFSAVYYMRNFDWKVGVENAFPVSDDESNLIFRGKAIRAEKLSTEVGVFDTIVVKPQIELKGKFQPVGDIYIWLSNDDRKYVLRIECAIKIGTLVSEVVELVPGAP